MNLYSKVSRILNSFRELGIYENNISLNIDKNKLYIGRNGKYADSDLENIIGGRRKVIFTDLPKNNQKIRGIVNFGSLYNRIINELCKKMPFSALKNEFYRSLGSKIDNGVIVAPNVFIDYLNPELIEIGAGSVIGEESMLLTHFLYPDSYEIGSIKIGKNCTIGVRAIIYPGINIGDNSKIGTNVVVYKDVPENSIIKSAL